MTREEFTDVFLPSNSKHFILQLPTSFGKTKQALQKVEQWYTEDCKILIVVPVLVLRDAWEDEIKKWKYDRFLNNITFTTYRSLPKYCSNTQSWDICIFDEVHHTSDRCKDAMKYLKVEHIIGLSATIKRDVLDFFKYKYKPEIIKIAIKDAIESDVLPDPKILLIPLILDNTRYTYTIEKNVKKGNKSPIKTIGYAEKWKYRSYKGPLRITCTQQQYYNDLSALIDWYKQKGENSAIMRNAWLHKAGERLKWLAQQKEVLIKALLKQLKNYRTLTFCQSIAQSESLGCPCVNSKVGTENLEKFNDKKIKHISAVAMLDEGVNLVECKIGLFQMINASDRISTQRIGRPLRHKEPVLIFPYYINTREQEIVDKLFKDYSSELITKISPLDIDNIKTYL